MGDLPKERTALLPAFQHTGVDYAGPIMVRLYKGRGYKAYKAYIVLFVCLSVRAIHMEVVTDYTADAFLAAFRRFAARLGTPLDLYSDNGTNFQGADAELKRAFRNVTKDNNLRAHLATDGTTWHFIPPGAPHFGGIWEAGVKSMKRHLHRVVGNKTLTLEEFTTFLTQVESCLNSRPLGPLHDDLTDLLPLTPGHFLTGRPLVAVPEPSLLDLNADRLSRWQLVQRLYQQLWNQWTHDYLHSLQERNKWQTAKPNIQQGELVLIHEENLPPTKWALSRVLECHPGRDGRVRVVTVRTATAKHLKIPITKVCPLLIRDSQSKLPTAESGGSQSRLSIAEPGGSQLKPISVKTRRSQSAQGGR